MAEYLSRGYLTTGELRGMGLIPPDEVVREKRVAVIECVQEIPCNPCSAICKVGAILKEGLCKPPRVDWEKCVGCRMCVAICPGLAIFCIQIKDGKGYVTMPYEMLPKPNKGDKAVLLSRAGEELGEGEVVEVFKMIKGDPAYVITVEAPRPELVYEVRAVRIAKGG